MKKVLFTSKIEDAMTFNSFSAATVAGEENLGEGMFKIEGKGGIRLVAVHPSIKTTTYVKEIK